MRRSRSTRPSSAGAPPAPEAAERRSGWLLALTGAAVFLAAADQTCVVAVLPKMIEDVGLAQDQFFRAAWIVNGYILGYIVAMPLLGRIADARGHGRVFALALALFGAGSVAVALATSLTELAIARGVQAVGGGALVPIALALVTTRLPAQRRALGLGAMAAAAEAGGLVGPLWGGGIAALAGWRVIFWLNLPLALPLALAIWRLAGRELSERRSRLDLAGATLLGASLVCLTVALTDDPIAPRSAAATTLLLLAAAALAAGFAWRQLHARVALVDVTVFRRPRLSAAFLVNGLVGGALIVAMVNVPLFTNVILGGSALAGGLNLMRLTLALAAGALLGGLLVPRLGVAVTAVLGLATAAGGFLGLTRWSADPAFLALTLPLLVAGLGFGLVIAPLNSAVMDEAALGDRATLAALLTLVRLLGALVGVALLTSRGLGGFYGQAGLIPLDDPRFSDLVRDLQIASFHHTFVIAGGVCCAAMAPALLLFRRAR